MITIAELDQARYWTGRTRQIAETDGCPPGWTRAPLPELGAGEKARLVAGAWAVVPAATVFAEQKAEKLAALADRRWRAETSGFLWNRPETDEVYYIATDAASQAKIDAERKAAEAGARREGDVWKCGDQATGLPAYVALTDAEIIDMSTAARTHVSDCFNREAELAAQIMAAEDEAALDAIDINSGWPG